MRRDEGGAVTAETATVIPVLVLVAALLAWLVAFGVAQVRAVDAARETARALARGEDQTTGTRLGLQIAPRGAKISVSRDGDSLVVTVTASIGGPSVLGFVPGHGVQAKAVAEREPES